MIKAKQRPVTMRDVAELAGVSKQTVSAVLNGKPGITAETQARIRQAVATLSYRLDNVASRLRTGRLAAEHLLGVGHRHLAHLGGPPTARMARDRWLGFQLAVAGQPDLPNPHIETANGWDYADGYQAMQRFLATGHPLTALFAAGDALASGPMCAIQSAGLLVPQQISVVGVDDIDSAAYQNPPLTTVRQSMTELARLSVQLLFDLLAVKEPMPATLVMDPVLVMRDSMAWMSAG